MPAISSAKACRRFEFIEGSSAKFWEIETEGSNVIVRFGRIGNVGQTQTKSFADAGAANDHAATLVAAKIKKGYRETGEG